MQGMLETALANPWDTLRSILDDPLHPGGREATEELLDRAAVTTGTQVADIGCGAGTSLSIARDRGANVVGVDRSPSGRETVRGDMRQLPLSNNSVEVVLAECVMCLTEQHETALTETARIVEPDGYLALSDVTVEGQLPDLPAPITTGLCLESSRSRQGTIEAIEAAGYDVIDVQNHRDDILAMQEKLEKKVDYEQILGLLGERGRRLLDGIHEAEAAVAEDRIGYLSVVAQRSM
ncbi:class I SAM-dependent methyltransferase [Haloquadratum walsbyi]|uniref:Probable S-adenosylmethionine-dependent methyltransferase n=1 Tax=Haloquadratum walsbyi (strain DSM 16854 / JCM 12705 / C23) TaxID=768065 RepID=G0LH32_HALWC|nr:class I SAM-dependent methyltransferase [Haloquadratum walsbyi]CCC40066.1 probable S-adenosylmethionine-dependent methyltransferase [Haloquadratum walsbyi C23]